VFDLDPIRCAMPFSLGGPESSFFSRACDTAQMANQILRDSFTCSYVPVFRGFIPAGLTIFAHHTRTHKEETLPSLLSAAYCESLMHVSGPVSVVRYLNLVTQSNRSFEAAFCLWNRV
jgi:hypothetical protein